MKLGCFLNLPLGISAQGIPKKCSDADILAASSAITNNINAISSSIAQSKANEANIEFGEETNALNYKLWQEQRDFAKAQYDLQRRHAVEDAKLARQQALQDRQYENEYNSPMAQRLRYQLAGINPYLAMAGQNAVGSVQSQQYQPNGVNGNLPSSPTMVAPHYDGSWTNALSQGMSKAFSDLTEGLYREESMKLEWIKALGDANFDRHTKDKLMNEVGIFEDDNAQRIMDEVRELDYQSKTYKLWSDTLAYSFQKELNAHERQVWGRESKLFTKTLEKVGEEIKTLKSQRMLYNTDGSIKRESLKLLQNEVKKMEEFRNDAPEWLQKFLNFMNNFLGGSLGQILSKLL